MTQPTWRRPSRLRSLLPARGDYAGVRTGWRRDVVSGITVAVVALPLALAFGIASGAGAQAGLVTAVVAGAVAAVFGGSHVQVSGPTGAMTVVLVPIVAAHGAGAVPTVALLAGVFLVAGSAVGLGRLLAYLPWPVIEGFTFGIAVVIAAQQVPTALGVPKPDGDQPLAVAGHALIAFGRDPHADAAGLLLLGLALMVVLPRLHRSLPVGLLTVLVVTLVTELAGLSAPVIGGLPRALPLPSLPGPDAAIDLLPAAAAVAALAALESLLSARVADGMTDVHRHDPDRELLGQGLANVGTSLFGGVPATGAIARTAVNVRSGARTRLASLSHALVLAGVMAALAGVVARVPLVALAAVLLGTAWRMVEWHTVRAVVRSTRTDATVFLVTAAATLLLDLVRAVELGVLIALVAAVTKLAQTATVVSEPVPVEVGDDTEHALLHEHVLVYRLDGPVFFAAASHFLAQLTAVTDVRVVVLRLGNVAMLDASGARMLAETIDQLGRRGITVLVKVASEQHRRLLHTVGALTDLDRLGHVLDELPAALDHARQHALGATTCRRPLVVAPV
jgi:sulfate permease, SulP family